MKIIKTFKKIFNLEESVDHLPTSYNAYKEYVRESLENESANYRRLNTRESLENIENRNETFYFEKWF